MASLMKGRQADHRQGVLKCRTRELTQGLDWPASSGRWSVDGTQTRGWPMPPTPGKRPPRLGSRTEEPLVRIDVLREADRSLDRGTKCTALEK